nr:integrase, catalytic region, zinc finger, CCHC-type, peptidase aspartic, catalytic [Tanacetum cinerariifolium]
MANLLKDIQCAGSDTRLPMLDKNDFASWQQYIRLYFRGKENGVNILKSIDEGPFQMGTVWELIAEGTKEAPHLGLERPRVYFDPSPEEKDRYITDIRATNILLQGLSKDIYTLINHYTDAKDIWDNVKMLLEGSELTKEDRESQLLQTTCYLNEQHEAHANENKMMLDRFTQHTVDPLALMSNVSHPHHYSPSSSTPPSTYVPPYLADNAYLDSGLSPTDNLIENLTNTLALLTQSYKPFLTQINNQLRTSSNTRNQAIVQDDRVVVQNVQCRHNRGQGTNPQGGGAAGYGGVQNRVGNANPGQARQFVKDKELHYVKLQLASTINHNKIMVEEVTSLKRDFKQKENKYLEDFLDMKSLKEKVKDRLFKQDQSLQTVHMLCRPKPYYNELNKVAVGYKNPLCLTRTKQVLHALYNGHEIIKDNNVLAIVHNTEDTLEIAKITRRKMNDKMKDPECVNHKVKIAPHDYSKENFLATFTPQKQLTPEQIFWSQDLIKMKTEALKEQTTASRPIKALVNNREAHLDYLRYLKESVETIREIVKEAKVVSPLDSSIFSTCRYTKHSQELLEYAISTCPQDSHQRDKKHAPTPLIRKKQVTFAEQCCSKHMTEDRSRLMNFIKKFIGTVRFGNDHFGAIMGYGDYVIGDSVISRVYYVEGLRHNLFSVGQFCDSDLEVAFRKHSWYVRDTNGVELIKGSRGFNLYTISVKDMIKSFPICLLSKASKNKS